MLDNVVVLASGGIDSSLLLAEAYRARRLAAAVFVHYRHAAGDLERETVRRLCSQYAAPLHVFDVPLALGRMADPIGAPGARIVPARNLVLIAIGLNVAASIGAGEVWIGANRDDWGDYPDCRPAWVDAVGNAARGAYNLPVRAPLSHMTGEQIVHRLRALGFDIGATVSCYTPHRGGACLRCSGCRRRSELLGVGAGAGGAV